jgi:aminopeptidase-like protein
VIDSTPTVARHEETGEALHALVRELYPLCRSITGSGTRETLRRLGALIPLNVYEVPTGTKVFDWTVPREWNIRDAYVKNASGERVIDFQQSNLHVVNYSVPVRLRATLHELRGRLHSLPEHPDWIPYRASYYSEGWGFCLRHRDLERLPEGEYEVCIDSRLEAGSLTYAECYIPGERPDEVLISTHVCHPSLANDNLSGMAVAAFLARALRERLRRYSYRFLFIPTTIGSIAWLARNEDTVGRIRHGLVLACLGDAGRSTYKKSRRGDAEIDRAVAHVLRVSGGEHEILDFTPYGYDERQFCSPGFDLPVGCLMRTPNGRFPEYHTSADDLEFVKPAALADSLAKCRQVIDILEGNDTYINRNPKGEPQLGRRGLYWPRAGQHALPAHEFALLWVLNLSDGHHSLLDIAEQSGLAFESVRGAADALLPHDLLAPVTGSP